MSSGVYRLRTEAVSFQNVVFVLNISDNRKSPCECWWRWRKQNTCNGPDICNALLLVEHSFLNTVTIVSHQFFLLQL